MFSTCPSVHPSVSLSVRLQTCERNMLQTNGHILIQLGTSGPQGKGIKRSTGCLQLWKTWKSQGICSFWKTQGI